MRLPWHRAPAEDKTTIVPGVFNIFELLSGPPPKITIVDVGAMSLGPGTDAYEPLLRHGSVRVVGFEPVQAECDKLNQMRAPGRLYLPYAIGDGHRRTFHECNPAWNSSLYEPYIELLDNFQNLGNLMQVVASSETDTHRLDDFEEVADTDYLKLDVQGAALDVFNGASNVLRRVVMIHTEVEFVPMYREQPLFSDVDQILRRNGFWLHRILATAGRTFKPLVTNNDINAPGSQLLWAEVAYIRNFMSLDEVEPEKLLKLAVLLHVLYGSVDTCAFVLQHYQRKTGDMLADRYMRRLTGRG